MRGRLGRPLGRLLAVLRLPLDARPQPATQHGSSRPFGRRLQNLQVQEDLSPQASPGTGPTPVPATVGAAVAAAQAQQAAAIKGGGISAVPTAATTVRTTGAAPVHTAGREGGAVGQPAAGRTHGEPAVEYRSGPEVRFVPASLLSMLCARCEPAVGVPVWPRGALIVLGHGVRRSAELLPCCIGQRVGRLSQRLFVSSAAACGPAKPGDPRLADYSHIPNPFRLLAAVLGPAQPGAREPGDAARHNGQALTCGGESLLDALFRSIMCDSYLKGWEMLPGTMHKPCPWRQVEWRQVDVSLAQRLLRFVCV